MDCQKGNHENLENTIKDMKKGKFDINVRNHSTGQYWTGLQFAAMYGHKEVVKIILKHNPNLELVAIEYLNSTPLLIASEKGYYYIVQLLANKGANLEARNQNGMTPLLLASKNGHIEICKFLINNQRKADLQTHCDGDGMTPLLLSCQYGYVEICHFMIQKGAYVNARNKDKATGLILACRYGHYEIAKIMLEKGCDIKANSNYGTAFEVAKHYGFTRIIAMLLLPRLGWNKFMSLF